MGSHQSVNDSKRAKRRQLAPEDQTRVKQQRAGSVPHERCSSRKIQRFLQRASNDSTASRRLNSDSSSANHTLTTTSSTNSGKASPNESTRIKADENIVADGSGSCVTLTNGHSSSEKLFSPLERKKALRRLVRDCGQPKSLLHGVSSIAQVASRATKQTTEQGQQRKRSHFGEKKTNNASKQSNNNCSSSSCSFGAEDSQVFIYPPDYRDLNECQKCSRDTRICNCTVAELPSSRNSSFSSSLSRSSSIVSSSSSSFSSLACHTSERAEEQVELKLTSSATVSSGHFVPSEHRLVVMKQSVKSCVERDTKSEIAPYDLCSTRGQSLKRAKATENDAAVFSELGFSNTSIVTTIANNNIGKTDKHYIEPTQAQEQKQQQQPEETINDGKCLSQDGAVSAGVDRRDSVRLRARSIPMQLSLTKPTLRCVTTSNSKQVDAIMSARQQALLAASSCSLSTSPIVTLTRSSIVSPMWSTSTTTTTLEYLGSRSLDQLQRAVWRRRSTSLSSQKGDKGSDTIRITSTSISIATTNQPGGNQAPSCEVTTSTTSELADHLVDDSSEFLTAHKQKNTSDYLPSEQCATICSQMMTDDVWRQSMSSGHASCLPIDVLAAELGPGGPLDASILDYSPILTSVRDYIETLNPSLLSLQTAPTLTSVSSPPLCLERQQMIFSHPLPNITAGQQLPNQLPKLAVTKVHATPVATVTTLSSNEPVPTVMTSAKGLTMILAPTSGNSNSSSNSSSTSNSNGSGDQTQQTDHLSSTGCVTDHSAPSTALLSSVVSVAHTASTIAPAREPSHPGADLAQSPTSGQCSSTKPDDASAQTVSSSEGKKSIFEGASKDEILEYLEDARERVPEVLIAADEVMVINENELILVNQLEPNSPATPISIVEAPQVTTSSGNDAAPIVAGAQKVSDGELGDSLAASSSSSSDNSANNSRSGSNENNASNDNELAKYRLEERRMSRRRVSQIMRPIKDTNEQIDVQTATTPENTGLEQQNIPQASENLRKNSSKSDGGWPNLTIETERAASATPCDTLALLAARSDSELGFGSNDLVSSMSGTTPDELRHYRELDDNSSRHSIDSSRTDSRLNSPFERHQTLELSTSSSTTTANYRESNKQNNQDNDVLRRKSTPEMLTEANEEEQQQQKQQQQQQEQRQQEPQQQKKQQQLNHQQGSIELDNNEQATLDTMMMLQARLSSKKSGSHSGVVSSSSAGSSSSSSSSSSSTASPKSSSSSPSSNRTSGNCSSVSGGAFYASSPLSCSSPFIMLGVGPRTGSQSRTDADDSGLSSDFALPALAKQQQQQCRKVADDTTNTRPHSDSGPMARLDVIEEIQQQQQRDISLNVQSRTNEQSTTNEQMCARERYGIPQAFAQQQVIKSQRSSSGQYAAINHRISKHRHLNQQLAMSDDDYNGSNEFQCLDCDQLIGASELFGATHNDPSSNSANDNGNIVEKPGQRRVERALELPLCKLCTKKRTERKEIISEFVDTELKYGRDLKIIHDEFYRPMQIAGLLTKEQINGVFLNLNELILAHRRFAERLVSVINEAHTIGDTDYNSVSIGRLFVESSDMLQTFESYCVRQGSAACLLARLAKEKELLRIFLRVSQMENTLLRRMNLAAFLMVPVQRVTKYPLLLNRLYKVTPYHHKDRESLRDAQLRVELHLEHINQQTKGTSATNKIWRRISNLSAPNISSATNSSVASSRRCLMNAEDIGYIRLRKTAIELLKWDRDETQFIHSGQLNYAPLNEYMVKQKMKSLRYISAHALLMILGKPNWKYRPDLVKPSLDYRLMTPALGGTGVREAALLLFREKNGRFIACREPLMLTNCVLSNDCSQYNSEYNNSLPPGANNGATATAAASGTGATTNSTGVTAGATTCAHQHHHHRHSHAAERKSGAVAAPVATSGSNVESAPTILAGGSAPPSSSELGQPMAAIELGSSTPISVSSATVSVADDKRSDLFKYQSPSRSESISMSSLRSLPEGRGGDACASGARTAISSSSSPPPLAPRSNSIASAPPPRASNASNQIGAPKSSTSTIGLNSTMLNQLMTRVNNYHQAHSAAAKTAASQGGGGLVDGPGQQASAAAAAASAATTTTATAVANAAAKQQKQAPINNCVQHYNHHFFHNHHQPYGHYEESFELHERLTKESLLLKADTPLKTRHWLQMLRYHAKDLGQWRARRNALANIMMMRQE